MVLNVSADLRQRLNIACTQQALLADVLVNDFKRRSGLNADQRQRR
jgi:hypothetical protein